MFVLDFMYFTPETMVLWGLVLTLFITLATLDKKKRSTPTKGFLPIYTTRGDRVFISLMSMAVIGIIWLTFIPLPIEFALIPSAIVAFLILTRG
jgi:predicted small integral membrane protein